MHVINVAEQILMLCILSILDIIMSKLVLLGRHYFTEHLKLQFFEQVPSKQNNGSFLNKKE